MWCLLYVENNNGDQCRYSRKQEQTDGVGEVDREEEKMIMNFTT